MATTNTNNVSNSAIRVARASVHNFAFGGQNWRDDSLNVPRAGGHAGEPTGYDWPSAAGQGQIFPTAQGS